MKILYIGNQLAHSGKSPTTIDTLSVYLKQESYEVVTYSKKQGQVARLVDMIIGILKNRKADYVLMDTYSTSAFWYAFIISQLCRILGMKYIPYLHGGDLPNRLDKNPKLCKSIFDNSYCNVAPSGYLKHEFEKRGFKNLRFIPNTIELKNYTFLQREITTPKILWVRSFAELYNPKLAIDVLVQLKQKYPEAELCMVGPEKDGSLSATQEYAKKNGVDVLFTGKMEKKDWISLSKNYNIFLNTTNFDNTPVSVMEAMALGLPVVSTNVGGLPYLIESGKDGFLVEPNNIHKMTDVIENLINNRDICKQTVNNARAKAESWDWNQVKKDWNSILK
nr:glycosyltransferase family 4 protein [uncultured Flavobacterium sp.]